MSTADLNHAPGQRPGWLPAAPTQRALDVLGVRTAWALALGLLALALFRLGGTPLFDVDEGAFSEATREIIAAGDWLRTTLNGEPRWDKPIGVYWLQGASVLLFGLNEFALRLPSALSGWGWALALVWFAAPRWGRSVALSAGAMLATSLGVLVIGRAATADALLNLLLTLTALDAWRWLESGRAAPLRRAWAFIGLGLLVKGPVAVVVPGAALLVWLLSWGRWQPAWQRLRAAFSDVPAWGLLLIIAVPWYAYILNRFGQAFIDGFLVKHNLARYSTPLEQHGGSLGYYGVVLPLMLLPWAPLLVSVLRQVRSHWADPLRRYLLGWGGFVVVFFSLSGTKLPHYVLYGVTPFVLLMALALQQAGRALRVALGAAVLLLLALVLVPAATLDQWAGQVGQPLYRALLSGAPAPWTVWLPGAVVALAVPWLLGTPRLSVAQGACGAALASSAVLLGGALPWWGEQLQGPVREAAALARSLPEPAVQWRVQLSSFSVYRERETPRRAPQPGELVLLRVDQAPSLLKARGGELSPVFEQRGIALMRWTGPASAEAGADAREDAK